MPYLEYPKAVYLGGDVAHESRVVQNADEEARAAADGFEAMPANPPAEPAQPGSPLHLPYPKIVYIDGDLGKESRRVENADEEVAAKADGFFAYVHPSAQPSDDALVDYAREVLNADDAESDAPEPKKRGRKKK